MTKTINACLDGYYAKTYRSDVSENDRKTKSQRARRENGRDRERDRERSITQISG